MQALKTILVIRSGQPTAILINETDFREGDEIFTASIPELKQGTKAWYQDQLDQALVKYEPTDTISQLKQLLP